MDVVTSVNEETGAEALEGIDAKLAPDGPFKITVEFGITDGKSAEENGMHGYATATFPPGKVPTDQEINNLAISALGQLPEGMRFMNRGEFVGQLIDEYTGGGIAIAVPEAQLSFRLDVFA